MSRVHRESKLLFCVLLLNDPGAPGERAAYKCAELKKIISTQSTKHVYPKEQILLSHRFLPPLTIVVLFPEMSWEEFGRRWPCRSCQCFCFHFENFCSKGGQNIFHRRAGFLLSLTQSLPVNALTLPYIILLGRIFKLCKHLNVQTKNCLLTESDTISCAITSFFFYFWQIILATLFVGS